MRTQIELLHRFNARKGADLFGFEVTDYLEYMTWETVKPLLSEEFAAKVAAGTEKWRTEEQTEEALRKTMFDYMEFAWGKANNCRGISANRSIMHFTAWLWMLGDDHGRFGDKLFDGYKYYGKPQLVAICERFAWDWQGWDDGHWLNNEEDAGITAKEALGR